LSVYLYYGVGVGFTVLPHPDALVAILWAVKLCSEKNPPVSNWTAA